MSNYIALVRCNPCALSPDRLPAAVFEASRRYKSKTVFFHGDGVAAARSLAPEGFGLPGESGGSKVELRVCRTSWMRRFAPAEPQSPLESASLTDFFDRLAHARRVDSFGVEGSRLSSTSGEPDTPPVSGRLLLEIAFAPADERQRREALEVALGAAALELDAAVLFRGPGLEHLSGRHARGWSQITDFDLLDVFVHAVGRKPETGIAVRFLGASQAQRLRADAETILGL